MTKLEVLTTSGAKAETVTVADVLTVSPKKELLHQAVVTYLANQRQANANTKTKGEVSGGGRKPWKQKGTGRARAGSSRSPIWIGGGITFGPTSERNYSKRLPDRMKTQALAMALSAKIAASDLTLIDKLDLALPKTKLAADLMNKLSTGKGIILLVTSETNQNLLRACRNLPGVNIVPASSLNTYIVLQAERIIMTPETLKLIEQKLTKQ